MYKKFTNYHTPIGINLKAERDAVLLVLPDATGSSGALMKIIKKLGLPTIRFDDVRLLTPEEQLRALSGGKRKILSRKISLEELALTYLEDIHFQLKSRNFTSDTPVSIIGYSGGGSLLKIMLSILENTKITREDGKDGAFNVSNDAYAFSDSQKEAIKDLKKHDIFPIYMDGLSPRVLPLTGRLEFAKHLKESLLRIEELKNEEFKTGKMKVKINSIIEAEGERKLITSRTEWGGHDWTSLPLEEQLSFIEKYVRVHVEGSNEGKKKGEKGARANALGYNKREDRIQKKVVQTVEVMLKNHLLYLVYGKRMFESEKNKINKGLFIYTESVRKEFDESRKDGSGDVNKDCVKILGYEVHQRVKQLLITDGDHYTMLSKEECVNKIVKLLLDNIPKGKRRNSLNDVKEEIEKVTESINVINRTIVNEEDFVRDKDFVRDIKALELKFEQLRKKIFSNGTTNKQALSNHFFNSKKVGEKKITGDNFESSVLKVTQI